jgi:hypothetical protein
MESIEYGVCCRDVKIPTHTTTIVVHNLYNTNSISDISSPISPLSNKPMSHEEFTLWSKMRMRRNKIFSYKTSPQAKWGVVGRRTIDG